MNTTYEIKLNLTRDQISEILDYRLGQKVVFNDEYIEDSLTIAESIKSSNLSDKYCRYFTAELMPVLNQLLSENTDSYDITNFQHRMLRKLANFSSSK